MRAAAIIMLALSVCGCISQDAEIKPDDAKMNALFANALGQGNKPAETSTTMFQQATADGGIAATVESSSTTQTLQTTSSTVQPSTTTSTLLRTIECKAIENAMGQKDCDKGYCNQTGMTCHYFQGTLLKAGRCVCMLRN
ncbi:MAG: hypothetical protein V1875_03355 [Candidatus Altiarchaeota archaeon]